MGRISPTKPPRRWDPHPTRGPVKSPGLVGTTRCHANPLPATALPPPHTSTPTAPKPLCQPAASHPLFPPPAMSPQPPKKPHQGPSSLGTLLGYSREGMGSHGDPRRGAPTPFGPPPPHHEHHQAQPLPHVASSQPPGRHPKHHQPYMYIYTTNPQNTRYIKFDTGTPPYKQFKEPTTVGGRDILAPHTRLSTTLQPLPSTARTRGPHRTQLRHSQEERGYGVGGLAEVDQGPPPSNLCGQRPPGRYQTGQTNEQTGKGRGRARARGTPVAPAPTPQPLLPPTPPSTRTGSQPQVGAGGGIRDPGEERGEVWAVHSDPQLPRTAHTSG